MERAYNHGRGPQYSSTGVSIGGDTLKLAYLDVSPGMAWLTGLGAVRGSE